MSDRPRLLDLYCCAGGASVGYHRAGFDVTGVDHKRMPRYPYTFHRDDALDYLDAHGHEYDAIHASPPCQAFTVAKHMKPDELLPDQLDIVAEHTPPRGHRDLVGPTRDALIALGKPWVIENVPYAPLINPITLCGSHFELRAVDVDGTLLQLRRHRLFESSVRLVSPGLCRHDPVIRTASVYGHGGTWDRAAQLGGGGGYVPPDSVCAALLGIDWHTDKRELSESIPPAYTQYVGAQIMAVIA